MSLLGRNDLKIMYAKIYTKPLFFITKYPGPPSQVVPGMMAILLGDLILQKN